MNRHKYKILSVDNHNCERSIVRAANVAIDEALIALFPIAVLAISSQAHICHLG